MKWIPQDAHWLLSECGKYTITKALNVPIPYTLWALEPKKRLGGYQSLEAAQVAANLIVSSKA